MKRMSSVLFALACCVSALACAGEMRLGEIAPVTAVKGANQFVPDAAFGGDKYLVVWQRSINEKARIECARVDASGKPLDTKPIELAPDGNWQLSPRVAFGSGVFLVTWYELRNGKDWDVYVARVSPEGKVLDTGGVPVSTAPDVAQILPAVAYDGKGFIVAWSELPVRPEIKYDKEWNYKLAAARVGLDGRPGPPVLLDAEYGSYNSTGGLKDWRGGCRNDAVEVDLAVAGDRLLIVAGGETYANLFTLDFKPVGPKKGLVAPGTVRRPTVATDGKDFLFSCWTGISRDARIKDFVRVNHDGTLPWGGNTESAYDPGKGAAFWGNKIQDIMGPALAFDGTQYVLVWQAWGSERGLGPRGVATHLFARRILPDGTSPEPAVKEPMPQKRTNDDGDVLVAGAGPDQPNCLPRLASDGKGHVLMVWEQHPTTSDGNVVAATRLITTK